MALFLRYKYSMLATAMKDERPRTNMEDSADITDEDAGLIVEFLDASDPNRCLT
jgi:hypothetical protein